MRKCFYAICAVVCGMMVSAAFVSCDKEGKDGSGITGWYFEGSSPVYREDFKPINAPDMEEFTDDGQWYPTHHWTDYCYEIQQQGFFHIIQTGSPKYWNFIHIVDGNLLEYYEGSAYKYGASGTRGKTMLYKFKNQDWGMMGFYSYSPTYFTYTRKGNNITIKYGDEETVFVVTDDGLVQSGSGKWTKYDINQTY